MSRTRRKKSAPLATELRRIFLAWLRHGVVGFPFAFGRTVLGTPSLGGALDGERLLDQVGEQALKLFDELGPLYGKAGQMILSRLSPEFQDMAATLRLTRLYGQWPPIPFSRVASILDAEIPTWRSKLQVEPHPIGVASMAQVHAATDSAGREWVIKIIKPQARTRLLESVLALEEVLNVASPIALSRAAKRSVSEVRDLCRALREEISLSREREVIQRVQEKLRSRRQKVLLIPEVNPEFCTDQVLVVERFRGISLADVVEGKVELSASAREKLARTMLQELLVQVFELGLFHADPHAGNLILTDSGSVGLFDWGLAGELRETDRRHIAAILRAVMALDVDLLVDALLEMAAESGRSVERAKVQKELRAVISLVKKGKDDPTRKPSLHQLIEASLAGAERLEIPVPEGLLLMAKSLITIEGLARGIDPKVSMLRAATPVLWRAAKPGVKEFMALAKKLPSFLRQFSMGIAFCVGFFAVALSSESVASDLSENRSSASHPDVAILGDSVSTGAGTHPALTYDPNALWEIFVGENSAPDLLAPPGENSRAVRLWPAPREHRFSAEWVMRGLVHALSRTLLDTEELSWGWFLARARGSSPESVLIAAENGARMQQAVAQLERVVAATNGGLPRELWLWFTGNDVCTRSEVFMTSVDLWEEQLENALTWILRNGQVPEGGTKVFLPAHLGLLQLVNSEEIAAKEVLAYGEKISCKALRERQFGPPEGWQPKTPEAQWFSNMVPPSPALLCPTVFGPAPSETAVANRIRAFREAAVRVVTKVSELQKAKYGTRMVSFQVVGATADLRFGADDIGGDCFHLSATGQRKIAEALAMEIKGQIEGEIRGEIKDQP